MTPESQTFSGKRNGKEKDFTDLKLQERKLSERD